jgi:hypothetical protein
LKNKVSYNIPKIKNLIFFPDFLILPGISYLKELQYEYADVFGLEFANVKYTGEYEFDNLLHKIKTVNVDNFELYK